MVLREIIVAVVIVTKTTVPVETIIIGGYFEISNITTVMILPIHTKPIE